jgi:hypothetical protein
MTRGAALLGVFVLFFFFGGGGGGPCDEMSLRVPQKKKYLIVAVNVSRIFPLELVIHISSSFTVSKSIAETHFIAVVSD